MDIKFVKKGTNPIFQPKGISEDQASKLINRSIIGAAVVGNWQRENQYVPCRLFKNIAAGVIPSSNSDFSELFPEGIGVFNESPEYLIESILNIRPGDRSSRVEEAQKIIESYTYAESMKRIFSALQK